MVDEVDECVSHCALLEPDFQHFGFGASSDVNDGTERE